MDVDAEAKQRVLLEVLALHPPAAAPTATAPVPEGDMRFCTLARRRIRDATDPEAIAYEEWFSQNLVSRKSGPYGWRFSGDALEVRIHQYPDRLDLVGRLGLDIDRLEHGKSQRAGRGWEGSMVNVLATGYAWATLDVTQECNTSLAVRSHGGAWTAPVRKAGAAVCEPEVNAAFYDMLRAFGADV
ncbi:MAG: hypothetical protein E6J91_33210 [Deltaproteobacteria bacterium]|nr:MAG: hypothetical protein E6J91_33210 [Deltaproteobacteria bacterium]